MQCHYEVLGIERDANDDEIKKSYRKLALRNHPDKNPDNIEECTKRFHLIQQAYEVLSDPQERAWYDKHREAILKGGLGHGDNYQDDSLDVYQYFNTSCFSGYNDNEKGFYTVYREVFKNLSAEDAEYEDEDNEERPDFGDSSSLYEDAVGPFYGYWESYTTKKSYVWVEKYDTREAPNRQVRRAMEQENKKLREKARRDRNEEVRALVAFVKKRDKRVQAYKKKLEERAQEVAKLAKERKEESRRKRLESLEGYKETEWSAMSALEKELENLEAGYADQFGEASESGSDVSNDEQENSNEDEEINYEDVPYCIACNKMFKTDKALRNHENSKKHKENVMALKEEMEEEDDLLEEDLQNDRLDEDLSESMLSENELKDDIEEPSPQKLSKKQKKKKRQQQKLQEFQDGIDSTEEKSYTEIKETFNGEAQSFEKKTKLSKKQKKQLKQQQKIMQDECDGNYESNSEKIDSEAANVESDSIKTEDEVLDKDTEKENKEANNVTAETFKEEVSAAALNNDSDKSKEHLQTAESGLSLKCNVCSQNFKSRNKLFDHIKKTGHALRVSASENDMHDRPEKKGKKKKSKR